jgi:hypothetical protein
MYHLYSLLRAPVMVPLYALKILVIVYYKTSLYNIERYFLGVSEKHTETPAKQRQLLCARLF